MNKLSSVSDHPRTNILLEKQLQGFKVRTWIIGGYAIPIVLSLLSAVAVFFNVQMVRSGEQSITRRVQVSEQIGDLAVNVQVMSRTVRGGILDADDESRRAYEEAFQHVDNILDELEILLIDAEQQDNLVRLRQQMDEYKQVNARLWAVINQNQQDASITFWQQNRGREQITNLTEAIEIVQDRETELVEETLQDQRDTLNTLVTVVIGSAALSIAIAIAASIWIIRNITQRLNETANTLAASTTEIAATVEQQERTASQQAASVSETTTTMDELGASSRQSSQQAEAATSAAQQALNLTDGGTAAVGKTLEGITVLRDKVSAIAEQILHLSEQTGQIGNISQLVSDLANQTNMLALNAAVEAVRAGEHGKGFSVVATEIRKLADQSKQSAQKINDLVTDIQHAINSTVMVTDEGTKTVEISVQSTQQTASAFAGVADAVNNVVINNQQISLNIKQQVTAIEQVVQAMNSINQGAKETANGIRQTRMGTQQLQQASEILKDMV
ncbi:methyl-accepting chemotaxis protein [Spirulina sp. CCNP1310]|uniref:methyl-accepting chemotaxis protein n=1 Tax=Spirulina sp. CCNP1310 TaxID=3110249 RepID=UPI002B211B45|nr:methyl-accepting chemotaxis protein [Spirulina sp. CCNP1310]MEA5421119.1 methyl-accepting chemotaxis protein [Spirulina sp. CCNP1310]